jgi:hypothetical protein
MTRVKHWQDVASFGLGAWLALSPWALGYRGDPNAMGGAVIAGLALMAVALGAMFAPRAWEEWALALIGLFAIASPWLLRFHDQPAVMRNAVLTGLAVVVLAAWTLLSGRDAGTWSGKGAAH